MRRIIIIINPVLRIVCNGVIAYRVNVRIRRSSRRSIITIIIINPVPSIVCNGVIAYRVSVRIIIIIITLVS